MCFSDTPETYKISQEVHKFTPPRKLLITEKQERLEEIRQAALSAKAALHPDPRPTPEEGEPGPLWVEDLMVVEEVAPPSLTAAVCLADDEDGWLAADDRGCCICECC